MIAAPSAHAAATGRVVAISLVTHANTGARCLACVDVVTAVTATYGLEHARAVAANRSGNAPIRIGARHAFVAYEAVGRGLAVHGLIASTSMLNVVLATIRLFDGVCLPVDSADEALVRSHLAAARLATTGNPHTEAGEGHASYPTTIHHSLPEKRRTRF
jgi:hypothetical protein